MTLFKKALALLLAAATVIPLAACGGATTAEEQPTVTVSETGSSETVSTATPSEDPSGEPVSTDDEPTEEPVVKYDIYEEVIGDVRVQIYSDSVLRVELKGKNGFADGKTLCVEDRTDWNGTPVERSVSDGKITLSCKGFKLLVPENATSLTGIWVTDTEGNNIWKYSSSLDCDEFLPAPSQTPAAWAFNDSPRITPTETPFATPENKEDGNDYNNWTYEPGTQDCYVFVSGKDPFKLREDFVHLTGRCDIVPLQTLGLWFSRYHAYREAEFLSLVEEFRSHGYPFDMMVVDTDWRAPGDGTGYRVNRSYFRDIAAFYERMKKLNVGVVMNDHVHNSSASMLSYAQLKWFNEGLSEKIEQGLGAWWYDRNWSFTLKSPFSEISGDLLGQYMYLSMSEMAAPVSNRTYLMSNVYFIRNGSYGSSANVSLHRYSIQWTGDIASTPASLKNEIENMVKVGYMTSLAYYSSDIGGHTGDPYDELFVRWTQYGALSPIMRYHSTSSVPARIPWERGEKVDAICCAYINMRYRLMPLYYTLAYENYAKGLPMVRRLDFYYPESAESRKNDQYLLGDDILIAPFSGGESDIIPASWFKTPDGKPGLSAKFFNNVDTSGEPVVSRIDEKLDFNWGTGSPASGVGSDNFSAIWEGTVTVGQYNVCLGTVSDDGVQLFIDGELAVDNWKASDSVTCYSNVILKAGTTHEIKVRYYEAGSGAVIRLVSKPMENDQYVDERDVFIPAGTWVNTFTGEEITGPKTIKVKMNIASSPIFVKKGSLTVLTTPKDHTEASDWANITLDVYASKGTSDTTTQYEDDGKTKAYKDGEYRLTTYKTTFDENGAMTLKVKTTLPENKDPLSFTTRTVTLRLHAEKISEVKLNGNALEVTKIAKDPSAYPFATEGGSPDGDVYTVTFTVNPGENYTLTAK